MGQHPPLALVAGARAGLGQSLLSRLQRGGFHVEGLGRTRPDMVVGEFYSIDLADEVALPALIKTIIADYGPSKIVILNTAELIIAPFATTKLADYQRTWVSQVQKLWC